jgi:hypothetical protein
MNNLDSFNKDKTKCSDCKEYFDLSEIYPYHVGKNLLDFCCNCVLSHINLDSYGGEKIDGFSFPSWASKNLFSKKYYVENNFYRDRACR